MSRISRVLCVHVPVWPLLYRLAGPAAVAQALSACGLEPPPTPPIFISVRYCSVEYCGGSITARSVGPSTAKPAPAASERSKGQPCAQGARPCRVIQQRAHSPCGRTQTKHPSHEMPPSPPPALPAPSAGADGFCTPPPRRPWCALPVSSAPHLPRPHLPRPHPPLPRHHRWEPRGLLRRGRGSPDKIRSASRLAWRQATWPRLRRQAGRARARPSLRYVPSRAGSPMVEYLGGYVA